MNKTAYLDIGSGHYKVKIIVSAYQDGGTAVYAVDCEDGQPFCTLSVNLPETKWLPERAWYGKHWSENEGFLQQLLEQGIIKEVPCSPAQSGFVDNIRAYQLK